MRFKTLIIFLLIVLAGVTLLTKVAVNNIQSKSHEGGTVIKSEKYVGDTALPKVEKSDTDVKLDEDILTTPENYLTRDGNYGVFTPKNIYSKDAGGPGIQLIPLSQEGKNIEYAISYKKGSISVVPRAVDDAKENPNKLQEGSMEEATEQSATDGGISSDTVTSAAVLKIGTINNKPTNAGPNDLYFIPGDDFEYKIHFTATEIETGWIKSSFDIIIKNIDGVYRIEKIIE